MKRWMLLILVTVLTAVFVPKVDLAHAGAGINAPGALQTPSGGTFYANSPLLRKFVDSLPGLDPVGINNLGQYLPVAVPDQITYPGSDYYELELVQYREQMHSDLPKVVLGPNGKTDPATTGGTLLRGYRQVINGVPQEPHYMGPIIVAQKDKPVRIKLTNKLPIGTAGKLFVPVDPTIMGAGMGPKAFDGLGNVIDCDPAVSACESYTENRGLIHLHGGFTPWISDGTPHQWTVPAGEHTPFLKGVSARDVPDMPASGDGTLTYYYTNAQSARLLFYHDHVFGTTRQDVYIGEAAGYIIQDPTEQNLVTTGVIPGANPGEEIPLVIQDRTFVPQDIAVQDAKWDTTTWGGYGDLWFPHVYETNQWPTNPNNSGANDYGRWDYGPWFWPIFPVTAANADIYTSATSAVPEAFMDTPIVNGTAYPYLNVDRKAYRFRILNACNDRYLNLQIYYVDPLDPKGTEVKMVPAVPQTPYELAADFTGQGLQLYGNGNWTTSNSSTVQDMVFSDATNTLYASLATGLWQHDGLTWTHINGAIPASMIVFGGNLYADFGPWGLWKWDGTTWTWMSGAQVQKMTATSTALYVSFAGAGIWSWNGTAWTKIANDQPRNLIATPSMLFVDFDYWGGFWQFSGTTWTQVNTAVMGTAAVGGTTLYVSFPGSGLWSYAGTTWTKILDGGVPLNMVATNTTLYGNFGAFGTWSWNGTSWTKILSESPLDMVASTTNLYINFGGLGLWKWNGLTWSQISGSQPHKMVPVSYVAAADWPTDGRAGGVPDPKLVGPNMIQIGTESGLLPQAYVVPNRPIDYEYFRRSVTVLNVSTKALFLGPAERADVIVDFSQVPPGSKLIFYNDAPAPVPGFDARYDYYTGDPDQTATGGAPSTTAGYGPNTRTIMQFRVSNAAAAPAFDLAALQAAMPAAYAASQPGPHVAESAYNAAYSASYADAYANIFTGSATQRTFDFVAGSTFSYVPDTTDPGYPTPVTVNAGETAHVPVINKTIQELFDTHGRMNATLGTELSFTSSLIQTTIPLGYLDPPTEILKPGELQIWKITHNGVDTHAIHFHLMDVQVINRVGWDGMVKPPDANELGWKDTVRMNPLEDIYVAVKANVPPVPFAVPNSVRPLDPTMPLGSTTEFTQIDPYTGQPPVDGSGNPITISNVMTDFGWEYVWHCHLLGHEENDMMRAMVLQVP